MLGHFRKLNRSGDTIVEVMIVLAVLGLAIGVSYATANDSLSTVRTAGQRSEATADSQAQIEDINQYIENYGASDLNNDGGGSFCFNPVSSLIISTNTSSCVFGNYTIIVYNCINDSNACSTYGVPSDSDTNTFVVNATWSNTHSLSLTYRADEL